MSQEYQPVNLINYLEEDTVNYRIITEADVAADPDYIDMARAAKSILFRSSDRFALAVLPVKERVSSAKLKRALGSSSLRFASPDELLSTMGCVSGECHPFGTLNDVPTFADQTLKHHENLFFSSGKKGSILEISLADYLQIAQPHIIDMIDQK